MRRGLRDRFALLGLAGVALLFWKLRYLTGVSTRTGGGRGYCVIDGEESH